MRLRRFVPALALVLAGLVVLALANGSAVGDGAALALVGAGGVLGVAAVFWEIGESEDRDRRAGRG